MEQSQEIKCKHVAQLEGKFEMSNRVYSPEGLCPTIRTMQGGGLEPKILEEPIVWDGYNQAVRKDSSCVGTLTRNCGADLKRNGQGIIEPIAYDEQNKYLRKDGIVGTLTTDGSSPKHNNRIVEPTKQFSRPHGFNKGGLLESEVFPAVRCSSTEDGNNGIIEKGYRVRKLTPKECWRLMGFDDESFGRAKGSGISDSQLYKQAGNSIVVDVLMAILKPIIGG